MNVLLYKFALASLYTKKYFLSVYSSAQFVITHIRNVQVLNRDFKVLIWHGGGTEHSMDSPRSVSLRGVGGHLYYSPAHSELSS